MTIKKGEEWASRGALPDGGVVVADDAEAHHVVDAARRADLPIPPLGLLAGDLCRTMGGLGDEARLRSPDATTAVCDLGSVLLDGKIHWFVSSLVARRSWWRGRAFVVMNAAWLGGWNLAPKAHPGDGLLDVLDVRVSPTQWLAVKRRLPVGDHLPHPGISVRRTAAFQVELERPTEVWLDGVAVGTAKVLSVRVEPDALTVVV